MKSQPTNKLVADKLSVRAEKRRRALLAFLRSDRLAWQDHDHPELAAGTAAWVRRLRSESERLSRP